MVRVIEYKELVAMVRVIDYGEGWWHRRVVGHGEGYMCLREGEGFRLISIMHSIYYNYR